MTQSIQYFNNVVAYMYLTPELAANRGVIAYNEAVEYIRTNGINVTTINPRDFPEKFNIHLFISQNLNAIELFRYNALLQKAYAQQGLYDAVAESQATFVPIFQTRVQLTTLNTFKLLDIGNPLNNKLVDQGSIIKITCSNRQMLIAKIVSINFTNETFVVECLDGFDVVDPNVVYTLHSIKVYDITRIAYVIYHRQYMTSPPSVRYDAVVDFNYDLYITLYPEAVSMTKEEAYINYLYYIGVKQLRIANAQDIMINSSNQPSVAPLAPVMTSADIDTDIVRARRFLDVPADAIVSLHGIELFYTTSNNTRHSRDVRYNGLITEYAIKSYVDRKFDEYADMGALKVTGDAAFQRNVYLEGKSNVAKNFETNLLSVKEKATFSNIDILGSIRVDQAAVFNNDVNVTGPLRLGKTLHVMGDATFDNNIDVSNEVDTAYITVKSNADVQGILFLGASNELAPSNWTLKDTSVLIENNKTEFKNNDVVITGNSLALHGARLTLDNTSIADLATLNVASSKHTKDAEFSCPVTFDATSSVVVEGKMDVNGKLVIHNELNTQDADIRINHGNLHITSGDVQIGDGSMYVVDGGINVENGGIEVHDGRLVMTRTGVGGTGTKVDASGISLGEGNLNIEKGNVDIELGNVKIELGNVDIGKGNVNIEEGDIVLTRGRVVVPGLNVLDERGLSLTVGGIEVGTGKVLLARDNVRLQVPFSTSADLSVSGATLALLDTDLKMTGAKQLYAPDTAGVFKDLSAIRSVTCSNAMACNVDTEKLNAVQVSSKDARFTGDLEVVGKMVSSSSNMAFFTGVSVAGNIDLKQDASVIGKVWCSNVTACNAQIGVGGMSVYGPVYVGDALTIDGKTTFRAPVAFGSSMTFSSSIDVKETLTCWSNASFKRLATFQDSTVMQGDAMFKRDMVLDGRLTMPNAGFVADNNGITSSKSITVSMLDTYRGDIEVLTCTESAVFKGAVDFLTSNVDFLSDVTFHGELNLKQPININSLSVAGNFVCNESMAQFKKTIYVDGLLVASNISVQNQGYANNFNVNNLSACNITYGGTLFDVKKDMVVRGRADMNTIAVDGDATIRGTLCANNDLIVVRHITAGSNAYFPNTMTCNLVAGTMTALYAAEFRENVSIQGNVSMLNNVDIHKSVQLIDGYKVSGGYCTYDNRTTTQNLGKVFMANLAVDNLTTCNLARMHSTHIDNQLSVLGNVTIDGSISAYDLSLNNDISKVQNVYSSGIIQGNTVRSFQHVDTPTVFCNRLCMSNLLMVDGGRVRTLVPLHTMGAIHASNLATFYKGAHVESSLTVDAVATFYEGAVVNRKLDVYGPARFANDVSCDCNLTVRHDLYIEGDLHLKNNVDLQRDISVNNLIAKVDINVIGAVNTHEIAVDDTLRVRGISYMPRIGIGSRAQGNGTTTPPTITDTLRCGILRVSDVATFDKNVTIGSATQPASLKVHGAIEATQVTQLSDARTKYQVEPVKDVDMFDALSRVSLRDFRRIVDDRSALGFMAQDFDVDPLLRRLLVRDGDVAVIDLLKDRQCRVVSADNKRIRVSDGMVGFFVAGQDVVLRDGRKFRIVACNDDRLEATLEPALGPMDLHITIVRLEASNLIKIDHTQMLPVALGLCGALFRRLVALEEKVKNALIG